VRYVSLVFVRALKPTICVVATSMFVTENCVGSSGIGIFGIDYQGALLLSPHNTVLNFAQLAIRPHDWFRLWPWSSRRQAAEY
jgi:hypothetical protein